MKEKDLVASLYPESGGQLLSVWMEMSDEWYLLGIRPRTSITKHLYNDINIGIECTLLTFADDTKLCSVVNTVMLSGRDLDKLEE